MIDLLRFVLTDGYTFFGTVLLLILIIGGILAILNRILSYFTIRRWGYPPSHCDVKGESSVSEID